MMIIGFIGCGNMAQAMIGGIVESKMVNADEIIVSNPSIDKLTKVNEKWGVHITQNNLDVLQANYIILAVKPHYYETVILEIQQHLKPSQVVVSIAPGKALHQLQTLFLQEQKLIRAMPNTPAMVGCGMTAVCANEVVTKEELTELCNIFDGFGKTSVIKENMMEAVISVSGSSPAYVYLFIESLADGAVREGMPREQAIEFAAQAVYGSAKMVLETGIHPAALKDAVCSPGGTTIEAVCALERGNFRASIEEAMRACANKAREM